MRNNIRELLKSRTSEQSRISKRKGVWYNEGMAPKLELPSLNLRELVQLRRSITVRHGLNDLQRYIDFEEFRPSLEKNMQVQQ